MFGTAESKYADMGMSGGSEPKNKLIGGSLSALLKSFGVGQEDSATPAPQAAVPPLPSSQSYQPIAPNYQLSGGRSEGVNPNGMSQYITPNFAQPQQAAPAQQNDENYISSFKLPRLP
jgi:hypothetical protein